MRSLILSAALLSTAFLLGCQEQGSSPVAPGVFAANAHLTTTGNILDDGQNYVGRILIVTDPSPSSVSHCGVVFFDHNCVIVNPGGGRTIITECGIDVTTSVSPGDRFEITHQASCDGRLDLILDHI